MTPVFPTLLSFCPHSQMLQCVFPKNKDSLLHNHSRLTKSKKFNMILLFNRHPVFKCCQLSSNVVESMFSPIRIQSPLQCCTEWSCLFSPLFLKVFQPFCEFLDIGISGGSRPILEYLSAWISYVYPRLDPGGAFLEGIPQQ